MYATTNAEEMCCIQEQFAQHPINYNVLKQIRMTILFCVWDKNVEAALALIRRS